MPEPTTRTPYDHALRLINETNRAIKCVTEFPDGRLRGVDSTAASGALVASSNLAVASALLAVADAIRTNSET